MADHYGFTADPNYGYSPYSGRTHYGSYPPSTLPLTAPPGPDNPDTVEQISVRIRNMHPEEMAALADQWQNAWAFLADVRGFLIRQSDLLRDEAWQSPAARDAFLRTGPGQTLAYLDIWMDAAQQNVTALRHLVDVSIEARYAMARLEAGYRREMTAAADVSLLENLEAWLTEGQGWDAAAREFVSAEQAQIRDRYRIEAQRLAQYYGDHFFDYIAVLTNGAGPPVQPMNAVLSGPAEATGPGGGLAPAQSPPPGGPAPGVLPPGDAVPQSGGARPPGTLPSPATVPPALPPSRLPGRTIRRPSGPAAPAVPPGGGREIRRTGPAVAPIPNGRPGDQRPTRTAPGAVPPAPAAPAGRPGRTAPRTTPPPAVLGRPGDRRTGSGPTTPVLPAPNGRPTRTATGGTPSAPTRGRPGDHGRPDDTAPPILNRPASPAVAPPWRPPRADRSPTAWSDMFGAEPTRRRAGDGVVDAPERARPDGGPWGLRSPAVTRPDGGPWDLRSPAVNRPAVAGRDDDRPEPDPGRVLRGR